MTVFQIIQLLMQFSGPESNYWSCIVIITGSVRCV